MEFATIYYDPEEQDELKKVEDIKQRLGTLGVTCTTSAVYFDEYYSAPPTPWLEISNATYYAHQVDTALLHMSNGE